MMKASGNKSWQSSLRIWLAAGGRYSLGYQPDMKQVSGERIIRLNMVSGRRIERRLKEELKIG
eukprot:1160545-Pelagomonas_calceolata.AAC.24